MCRIKRAGRRGRKRCHRWETKEQVMSAVRFPVGACEPSTKDVARQVGVAVSTYLINILKELYIENKIDMVESVNSRGNVRYNWYVGYEKMKRDILPF